MFGKRLLALMSLFVFFGLAGVEIFAQNAPVRGTVKLRQADGTMVPAVDAMVEPIRTDIDQGKLPGTKTNKNGEFAFVSLSMGQTYVLVVSGPGMAPTISNTIRGGMDSIEVTVSPGDGKRLTEAEARDLLARLKGGTPQSTEDQKKADAEYQAKLKEVNEKNQKAQKSNDIINAALKAGNDAFNSKNYDVAVAKYTEGIEADPDFVGSAPILYKNKGAAYTRVAVDAYNAGVKATDPAEKSASNAKARKAFVDAAESYLNGWNILKNAPATDVTDQTRHETLKLETLVGASEAFRLAVSTEKIDDRMVEIAKIMIPEYLNLERDAAKKAQASLTAADLYRIKEDREGAIAGYRKVLEVSPDNADALAYLGIVLVDLGWIKDNDKALTQEGANYLQKFVSIAPDSHKLKEGAVQYLDILKTQNVVPDKKAPARKKP